MEPAEYAVVPPILFVFSTTNTSNPIKAEVSAAVCFLLSDAAAYINGVCIRVDGGSPLGSGAWPLKETKKYKSFDGFHLSKLPDVLDGEL